MDENAAVAMKSRPLSCSGFRLSTYLWLWTGLLYHIFPPMLCQGRSLRSLGLNHKKLFHFTFCMATQCLTGTFKVKVSPWWNRHNHRVKISTAAALWFSYSVPCLSCLAVPYFLLLKNMCGLGHSFSMFLRSHTITQTDILHQCVDHT